MKGHALVNKLLSDGYGIYDIAIMVDVDIANIRHHVEELRSDGTLEYVLEGRIVGVNQKGTHDERT